MWEVEQEQGVVAASTNAVGFRWLEHICCFADNRHPRVFLAMGILLLLYFRERQAAYHTRVDYRPPLGYAGRSTEGGELLLGCRKDKGTQRN